MTNKIHTISGGDGEPPEPDWSMIFADQFDIEHAQNEWGLVIRELRSAETLAVCNGNSIQRLVEFRVQYRRAANHVAEHGVILLATPTGKAGRWNLFWSVMRQADNHIRAMEVELCLSPRYRSSATKAKRRMKTGRPVDDYLGTTNR